MSKNSGLKQRLVTGLTGAAIAVALILTVPPDGAFLLWFGAFFWASIEFTRIASNLAPTAPLRSLWLWVPVAALSGAWMLREAIELPAPALVVVAFAPVLIAALTTLWSRCEMRDAPASMGFLAFAIPYFSLPAVCFYQLHLLDSWLSFLVLAIVAFSDAAAYFVGKAFGKHKLAPRVSPKKTWEGTLGGFATAVLATAVWSHLRLGEIRPALLLLAAVTAVAAQVGDLVESMVKRGAGVKDSGSILPGHGGFYDRLDAMILATPVFVIGLWLIGFEVGLP